MLFNLRGSLPTRTKILIEVGGAIFFIFVWWALVQFHAVKPGILPPPWHVVTCLPELWQSDGLVRNALYSIKLNLLGYIEAVAISLPFGFLIGLFPFFRAMCGRYVLAARFLPLSAVIGLFILWFGISSLMKIQFLTLGILVYMLAVVVQRIDEVPQVYVDTIKTLGASKWQTIRHVFIPDVVSRLSDDIRVLVAISWTYIIIAEVINKGEGGVGAMVFTAGRQSRVDKVFAILVFIILIGYLQDKLFTYFDKKLFPHKHV